MLLKGVLLLIIGVSGWIFFERYTNKNKGDTKRFFSWTYTYANIWCVHGSGDFNNITSFRGLKSK